MPTPFPPDLWDRLCTFLAEHETCQVTIHQHQGRVNKLDLHETVRTTSVLMSTNQPTRSQNEPRSLKNLLTKM